MQKLCLIILLLLCFICLSCKSRKSHVRNDLQEIVQENRELNNKDVQAISFRTQNASFLLDRVWKNTVQLINFTGDILTEGTIKGTADVVSFQQLGKKVIRDTHSFQQKDTVAFRQKDEKDSTNKQKQRKIIAEKETEGLKVYWQWFVGFVSIWFLMYTIYCRIKSKQT